ncbi:hypothetical protein [Cloacibacillus sp. An23]|uniref:hypothetical protein n=1 Tax=Cloacibacillus sp. An23 TaxID=1965591 RepID=UPI000B36D801|nr:hypothetical protein [Cloacibacillus sp. An23]OUO91136.1 hypothetical protein B5F39_13175 [Cloacibacillus sp. An23]
MTHIGRLYNSFIWAAAVSAALFQNTWLEMRVNMGLVLFALFALFFVVSAIWNVRFSLLFTTASLVLICAAGAFFLGPSRMCVLPALIIREGLGARLVGVPAINAAAAAFLVIGYVLIAFGALRGRRRRW